MKKTDEKPDIAKLVQIERRRDFARFRARELAAVDAVNTGIHGKLITPLEKSTDEQLFEAFTGGESANYWGPFFSKRLTLDESAGLLMALDTSRVELAACIAGRKIPEKNWPSFLIAVKLVKAFKVTRGHVEVALQKKDLFADSDGKYGAADLIEWAKEKDFVADEVLSAWEAHNQPETEDAEQVGAAATAGSEMEIKPIQRGQAQAAAILETIKTLGQDPLRLPKNPDGKQGVKAEVRKAV